jgi:hypothetical protein
MSHEATHTDDRVSAGGRAGSTPLGQGGVADVLGRSQPQGLHPAPTVRHPGLKTFLKTDYRGVAQFLAAFAEIRTDLGLEKVPHYSTLCYAEQRLLKKGRSSASSCVPPHPRPTAA